VAVSGSATLGAVDLDGTVSGTDANSGAAVSDSSAGSADGWTVLTPAALEILSVRASPGLVSRGQTGIAVAMVVRNTGEAVANVASSSLTFNAGGTDVASEYTVAPGANLASIAGGATTTFTYTVTVGGSATLGAIDLDGMVSGTDANGGDSVSDSGAGTADGWTVQTPAGLEVVSVSAVPSTVSLGQTGVSVLVQVRNTGQALANVAASGPTFMAGGTEVTSEYTVTAGSNPLSVAGGATTTFSYTVAVNGSATLGAVDLDATVSGSDANSGEVLSDDTASGTDAWTVQAPATLEVVNVSAAPSSVSRGQTGVLVSVQVRNSGQAVANVAASGLKFAAVGTDVTSEYAVTAGANPVSVVGSTTTTFTYIVAVSGSATLGAVDLDAAVSGADANSGEVLSDDTASTTDAWTVQAPATLEVVSISAAPSSVSRGQTGVLVAVQVRNTGQAVANVAASGLTFTAVGSDVTSEYAVTAGANPASVAGGAMATFSYTVAVDGSATLGAVGLDAAVSGTDANSAVSVSDIGAGTADGWTVQTPAALEILSVQASPGLVSRGQTGIAVAMIVRNTGEALANVVSSGLAFEAGGTDVALEYTLTPGTATLGAVDLDGTVSGTDANSGVVLSDDAAGTADAWTVQTPAALEILNVQASAGLVSRGQTGIAVAMVVRNAGEALANVVSSGLTFEAGGTDVASEYTVAPGTHPASVA
ncbi:MAG: hypothetical protein FD127_3947, partial [Acidimicrobiaceae bacterium]